MKQKPLPAGLGPVTFERMFQSLRSRSPSPVLFCLSEAAVPVTVVVTHADCAAGMALASPNDVAHPETKTLECCKLLCC